MLHRQVGDSNNTTNVVVAIDPKHALVIGKASGFRV
jgi:hypothetical protein